MQKLKISGFLSGFFYAAIVAGVFGPSNYSLAQQLHPSTGNPHIEIKVKGAGDPPQWYKEDVTPAQQYQTARKEAGAAYNQALTQCRTLAGSERTACLAEARATYNEDLAALKQQYGK